MTESAYQEEPGKDPNQVIAEALGEDVVESAPQGMDDAFGDGTQDDVVQPDAPAQQEAPADQAPTALTADELKELETLRDRWQHQQSHITTLQRENAELRELRKAAELEGRIDKKFESLAEALNKRPKTKEELEKEVQDELDQINADPRAYVRRQVEDALKAEKEQLLAETRKEIEARDAKIAPILQQQEILSMYTSLAKTTPELQNNEFKKFIRSDEVLDKTLAKLDPTMVEQRGAEGLYKDPLFHQLLVSTAKEIAGDRFQATQQQSQQQLAQQQAVAVGMSGVSQENGAPSGDPRSQNTTKLSPDDQFRQALLNVPGSFDQAMASGFKSS